MGKKKVTSLKRHDVVKFGAKFRTVASVNKNVKISVKRYIRAIHFTDGHTALYESDVDVETQD